MQNRKGSWVRAWMTISVICLCLGLCYGLETKLPSPSPGHQMTLPEKFQAWRNRTNPLVQPGAERLNYAYFTRGGKVYRY